MNRTPYILLVAAALGLMEAGAPRLAIAEESELRVTLAPEITSTSTEAFGSDATTATFGGQLSAAHGLHDSLELGVVFAYQTRSDVLFTAPTLDGITGADLTLYANLQNFQAGAAVRYLVGGSVVPLFARWHPTVELAVGLSHRRLSNLMAFTGAGTFAGDVPADTAWSLYAELRAGVTFRWTDHLQLGVLGLAGAASMTRSHGALVEMSWQTSSPLFL